MTSAIYSTPKVGSSAIILYALWWSINTSRMTKNYRRQNLITIAINYPSPFCPISFHERERDMGAGARARSVGKFRRIFPQGHIFRKFQSVPDLKSRVISQIPLKFFAIENSVFSFPVSHFIFTIKITVPVWNGIPESCFSHVQMWIGIWELFCTKNVAQSDGLPACLPFPSIPSLFGQKQLADCPPSCVEIAATSRPTRGASIISF